jgi:hypothetical protein
VRRSPGQLGGSRVKPLSLDQIRSVPLAETSNVCART